MENIAAISPLLGFFPLIIIVPVYVIAECCHSRATMAARSQLPLLPGPELRVAPAGPGRDHPAPDGPAVLRWRGPRLAGRQGLVLRPAQLSLTARGSSLGRPLVFSLQVRGSVQPAPRPVPYLQVLLGRVGPGPRVEGDEADGARRLPVLACQEAWSCQEAWA